MVQQPWHRTKQERVPASIGQQHYELDGIPGSTRLA